MADAVDSKSIGVNNLVRVQVPPSAPENRGHPGFFLGGVSSAELSQDLFREDAFVTIKKDRIEISGNWRNQASLRERY